MSMTDWLRAGLLALCGVMATAAVAEEGENTVAVFAGGCFWCMQPPFDALDGVLRTEVGYTGGRGANPSYEDVTRGGTGHVEAVRVHYDPARVSYEALLDVFWRNIDPLDDGGQFCDRGAHYRAAIFARDDGQREAAEHSRQALVESGRFERPIVTAVRGAARFYLAEAYHQDYYKKRPLRYRYYRHGCGRDARLQQLWGSDG